MMKQLLVFSLLSLSAGSCVADAADCAPKSGKRMAVPAKIAVVDFQKIINFEEPTNAPSLEWKDIMVELEKKLKPRLEKIQNMQTKLQKESKQMREQMSGDEDTAAGLMKLENDIQIDAKSYQSYSQKLLAEAQATFGEKVKAVIEEVAAEQGWTHVLPGPMLYVSESCDITNDVLERLNKNYREEMRKKKFAAAQKN